MLNDKTKEVLESEGWVFDRVGDEVIKYKLHENKPYSELFPIHDFIFTDNNLETVD